MLLAGGDADAVLARAEVGVNHGEGVASSGAEASGVLVFLGRENLLDDGNEEAPGPGMPLLVAKAARDS